MSPPGVPDIVVGRLPMYLRELTKMAEEGKEITSSQELGKRLGISSTQIRKDLSQFGEFGKQGTGYNINFLIMQLQLILKLEDVWDVVLVGAGDLGHAIANYGGFSDRGFHLSLIFDNDPKKIGHHVGSYIVKDVSSLVKDIRARNIRVAMLAVPTVDAQTVTDRLIEAGIHAILCYSQTSIRVPEGVKVEYIDPVLHLQHMTYYLP